MAVRAGRTAKVSISLRHEHLVALRKRAKRLHGGNLSAAIAELAADAARFEKMHELVEMLGGATLTDADRAAIDAEWGLRGTGPKKRRKGATKDAAA